MQQGHDNAVLKSIQGVKGWENIKGLPRPRQALERGLAFGFPEMYSFMEESIVDPLHERIGER
jgi:hypothetical protein